jgi:hypothetical protein
MLKKKERTMRKCCLTLAIALAALIAIASPRVAAAQGTSGKDCRMEQQCHWKDFKKICVWVKVCR